MHLMLNLLNKSVPLRKDQDFTYFHYVYYFRVITECNDNDNDNNN